MSLRPQDGAQSGCPSCVSSALIVGTWGICEDKCRDWQSHTAEELGKGLRQGSALDTHG